MAMAGDSELATLPCELLEWDSEHFGFPIARVNGDRLSAGSAEAIDEWCTDRGIRCLYFLADANEPETARIASQHAFRVVDVRVTAQRSLDDVDDLPLGGPEEMVIREGTEEHLEAARRIAARSHYGSRFYFDGRFPRQRCDALYETWVERGLRDPDRTVLIPRLGGDLAGYMVLAPVEPGGVADIELTAIEEQHRGKGIGRALHVAAFRNLAARGARTQSCAMSIRNIRMHEQLNFLTARVEVWHHKWYQR
jgi:GNAT superfamily N-acetyltransferase